MNNIKGKETIRWKRQTCFDKQILQRSLQVEYQT